MKKIQKHSDLKDIFDKSYSNLVFQALRLLKNKENAEDVVQDCFITLWNKKDSLTITGNIHAYLAKMVRNKCLDFLKKKRLETSELNESYQGSFNAEDVLETKDLQSQIDKTIDDLPEKCRQVFVLNRFEDMSYKEIADQLDISKKTVEAHISKALKSLRIGLKKFLIIIFKQN